MIGMRGSCVLLSVMEDLHASVQCYTVWQYLLLPFAPHILTVAIENELTSLCCW